jgi:hypothetical protein
MIELAGEEHVTDKIRPSSLRVTRALQSEMIDPPRKVPCVNIYFDPYFCHIAGIISHYRFELALRLKVSEWIRLRYHGRLPPGSTLRAEKRHFLRMYSDGVSGSESSERTAKLFIVPSSIQATFSGQHISGIGRLSSIGGCAAADETI